MMDEDDDDDEEQRGQRDRPLLAEINEKQSERTVQEPQPNYSASEREDGISMSGISFGP